MDQIGRVCHRGRGASQGSRVIKVRAVHSPECTRPAINRMPRSSYSAHEDGHSLRRLWLSNPHRRRSLGGTRAQNILLE
jgi:hypothetical protein